jgi:hypothetical protein
MQQPNVPWWVAVLIVVLAAMITAALAFNDPAVTVITPTIKFVLFIVNVGLTTLAAVLNIRKPTP